MFVVARYSSNGSLDTTFASDGSAETDFGDNDFAIALALQTDGKVVVAGFSGEDFALARYGANGVLDGAFSGNGKLTTDFGAGEDYALDVAIQPDGKVVAAGRASNRPAVARYAADGTPDGGFDGDGKVTATSVFMSEEVGMALQGDGGIVLAGRIVQSLRAGFGILRFGSGGALDATFDGDGVVLTHLDGASNEDAADVVIQPDGKIVVVGFTDAGAGDGDLLVARFDATGSLDPGFGGDGIVTADTGSAGFERAWAVSLQSDGKIVVAGSRVSPGGNDFALIRFNGNGSLDTGFDGDGIVTTDFGGNQDGAQDVRIQADGKIVAAGLGAGHDFAVARYNANGSLDTGFDGDGKVLTNFGGLEGINEIGIQGDGKIVAAGYVTSPYDFALARYTTSGSLDTDFSGDGKVTTHLGGDDGASSVVIQPDGRIVAAGGTSVGDEYWCAGSIQHGRNARQHFDGDGVVAGGTPAESLALEPGGKLITAGSIGSRACGTSR